MSQIQSTFSNTIFYFQAFIGAINFLPIENVKFAFDLFSINIYKKSSSFDEIL